MTTPKKTISCFKICVFFVILSMGVSCSYKSYFTANTRKLIESKNIPLNKIQFYVDKDITLERVVNSGSTEIKSGKVEIESGKNINIIVLKKNTPGVCTKINSNSLEISFEEGDGKSITFTETLSGKFNFYQVSAEKWIKDQGQLTYDGNKYYIQTAGSDAKLLINKKIIKNITVEQRKMKGIKIE